MTTTCNNYVLQIEMADTLHKKGYTSGHLDALTQFRDMSPGRKGMIFISTAHVLRFKTMIKSFIIQIRICIDIQHHPTVTQRQ